LRTVSLCSKPFVVFVEKHSVMTNATTANLSEERYWVMLVLAFGLGVTTTLLAVSCLVWCRRTKNRWCLGTDTSNDDVSRKLHETERSGSASTSTLALESSRHTLGGTVAEIKSRLPSWRGTMRSSGCYPPQTTSLLSQAALASAALHAHHFAHDDNNDAEQDAMSECAPSSISSRDDCYQEMPHHSNLVEFALEDCLLEPAVQYRQTEPVWTAPAPVPRWRLFGNETTVPVLEHPTADTETVAVSNCQSILVGSAPISSHHSRTSSSRGAMLDDECRAYNDAVYSRSAECRLALHVV
jgi:hypothetical protein